MAMINGQSLNKRNPDIAHNYTAVASVPCVTSQHLSAPTSHIVTSLDPSPFEGDVIYGRPQLGQLDQPFILSGR